MSIAAIPTIYRGIEFRSRLEAKWATMFDQLEWPWEYEPIDLAGYIPDFHIDFGERQFFIEIKPEMNNNQLYSAMAKAQDASDGCDEDLLVLGGSIGMKFPSDHRWWLNALICQRDGSVCNDVYLAGCPCCSRLVPMTQDGVWRFPCCGRFNDDNKTFPYELDEGGRVRQAWSVATNTVKYRNLKR
jgi:hypothetical protein